MKATLRWISLAWAVTVAHWAAAAPGETPAAYQAFPCWQGLHNTACTV